MTSHLFGSRVCRLAVALTLLTVGPMALPGGPLNGDRLLPLARGLSARAEPVSSRVLTRDVGASSSVAQSPDRQIAHSSPVDPRSLPPGLLPALVETTQQRAGSRYAFQRVDDPDGAFRAVNPAQQFETTFASDGVRLTSIRRDQRDQHDRPLTLQLATIADQRLIPGTWHSADARMVRDHRTADGQRLTEWYLNSPMGLEQGFTIQGSGIRGLQSGQDADTLRLTMEIGDQASVVFGPEGKGAVLSDPSGQVRLAYGAVDAWDATGRRLPARLEPAAGALSLVVTTRDAQYPLTIDPIIQQAKLTASDGTGGDWFGYTVALSGDTALVGAFHDDGARGSAYVFTRSGGVWTQEAKLTASDGAGGDQFGFVALSGDTALVGADGALGPPTNQGSAYVFTRSGGVWTQQAKLTASDGAAGDQFGHIVALDGDTALVGAPRVDVGVNTDQGSAYVFTRSGGVWTQQAKLTASDGAASDLFGFIVAVEDDTALVSALLDDVGANANQGSAYVFTRSAGVWTQQAHLTASDGAAGDQFGGNAVALSGDTALVTAFLDDVGANGNQGSAYVFTRSGGVWTQQAKLTASDGAADDQAGHGAALSGNTVVLGAFNQKVGANAGQGSAYVFTRSAGVWTQRAKLTASDGGAGDQFGNHIALSGQTALVGARFADVGANVDQGSAYVFTGVGNQPPSITSVLASPANLFPADRRMMRVNLAVVASDDFDPSPSCAIDSVVSNQPPRGVGPDIIISPPLAVDLRAERPTGGANRKYTITVKCTDGDGAFSTAQKVVEVTGVR